MKKLLSIPILSTSYLLLSTATAFAQATEEVNIGDKVQSFFGFKCIQHFIFRIVDIGLILAGLLLFIYLVWGGIEWLTSGGDKGKIENARNKITNALIGVAIIAASYAVWTLALTFFGIDLSNICSANPIPG